MSETDTKSVKTEVAETKENESEECTDNSEKHLIENEENIITTTEPATEESKVDDDKIAMDQKDKSNANSAATNEKEETFSKNSTDATESVTTNEQDNQSTTMEVEGKSTEINKENSDAKPEENVGETMFKKSLKSSGVINNLEQNCVAEPLLFPDNSTNNDSGVSEEEYSEESIFTDNEIPCVLCDFNEKNDSEKSQQDYLCHLVLAHNLVIADVKLIADLRKYAIYWKKRFEENDMKDFCVVIKTNTFSKDHDANYNMLCDTLAEDKEIREKLHIEKLKSLLDQQTKERNDSGFRRMCLFCSKLFEGNRISLFSHMNEDHNFNVGHPDNIVNVLSFLDEVEKKLNKDQCLFCEKSFRDRPALREHMRKKAHRRLNPKNKDYDKYYIINYLELGKSWEALHAENDLADFNEDWSGWDEVSQNAVCFFCDESFVTPESVYSHMESHGFDFGFLRKEMHLSFYQQVKMINYIRREVHKMNEMIGSKDDESHPKNADEKAKYTLDQIKTSTKWNQPQYYFPTYENDSLLCQLEDKEGLFEPEDTFVVGEDGIDCKTIINESVLTDLVVGGFFD